MADDPLPIERMMGLNATPESLAALERLPQPQDVADAGDPPASPPFDRSLGGRAARQLERNRALIEDPRTSAEGFMNALGATNYILRQIAEEAKVPVAGIEPSLTASEIEAVIRVAQETGEPRSRAALAISGIRLALAERASSMPVAGTEQDVAGAGDPPLDDAEDVEEVALVLAELQPGYEAPAMLHRYAALLRSMVPVAGNQLADLVTLFQKRADEAHSSAYGNLDPDGSSRWSADEAAYYEGAADEAKAALRTVQEAMVATGGTE